MEKITFKPEEWHNIASGRIFILGVGPTLCDMDLSGLKDEVTFGCNRLPLWDDLPFIPTYYGLTEPYNAEQIAYYDEMTWAHWGEKIPVRFVVNPDPVKTEGWIWVEKELETGPLAMRNHGIVGLGKDFAPLKTGRTSPLTLSQIALWMGYREIYFVGIDFSEKGYCFDRDADPGVTVHERTIKAARASFKVARTAVEKARGIMCDCTPDGKMNGALNYIPLGEVLNE